MPVSMSVLLDIWTYGNKSIYQLVISQSASMVSKTDFPMLWLTSEMGNGVSAHYISFLLKTIDGKLIEDGIKGKRAVPNIHIF